MLALQVFGDGTKYKALETTQKSPAPVRGAYSAPPCGSEIEVAWVINLDEDDDTESEQESSLIAHGHTTFFNKDELHTTRTRLVWWEAIVIAHLESATGEAEKSLGMGDDVNEVSRLCLGHNFSSIKSNNPTKKGAHQVRAKLQYAAQHGFDIEERDVEFCSETVLYDIALAQTFEWRSTS